MTQSNKIMGLGQVDRRPPGIVVSASVNEALQVPSPVYRSAKSDLWSHGRSVLIANYLLNTKLSNVLKPR